MDNCTHLSSRYPFQNPFHECSGVGVYIQIHAERKKKL